MAQIKLGAKQKRGLVIISAGVLGANAVLLPFNVDIINGLLNTAIVGPVTVGLLVGAAGLLSAYMLITKKM
ncbi:unnamed protein product [marine sediment metagenome]|uniref:Uncharacterized protein n=1 Tax=marine sediment metagenome TaxID=412755 RepID=X1LLD9_9ZZZZ